MAAGSALRHEEPARSTSGTHAYLLRGRRAAWRSGSHRIGRARLGPAETVAQPQEEIIQLVVAVNVIVRFGGGDARDRLAAARDDEHATLERGVQPDMGVVVEDDQV